MLRSGCRLAGRRLASLTASPRPIGQHVAHELRLQFLRASLAAYVQRALLHRELFIPGRQMHDGMLEVVKRTPHDPPAVARPFHDSAIRPSTAVKRIQSGERVGHDRRIVAEQRLAGVDRGSPCRLPVGRGVAQFRFQGRVQIDVSVLDELAEHLVRVDGKKQAAAAGQNFALLVKNLGDVDVLAAIHFFFA